MDDFRYETSDGESPSRFGALAALPAVALAWALIAVVAWAVSRAAS
jgi:hypothetical protein